MPKLITNEYLSHFAKRGIPHSVLLENFPLEYSEMLTSFTHEIDGKPHFITQKRQNEMLEKLSTSQRNFIAVISGQYDASLASQVALFTIVSRLQANSQFQFYWHQVRGWGADKILFNDVEREQVLASQMLIISGLSANSLPAKLENIRDCLTTYSHLPRIIVAAGLNPLAIAYEQLFIRPNLVFYFGKLGKDNT